jgi:hypothetical protein
VLRSAADKLDSLDRKYTKMVDDAYARSAATDPVRFSRDRSTGQ